MLFANKWRRIVLDEGKNYEQLISLAVPCLTLKAHLIRNSNSRMAKATCALQATARWAVSGTPIQNRLGDLTSLFKFLQVYPYGDSDQFDRDITFVWKGGEAEKALDRLKRLAGCIILRRPKDAINLPSRRDLRYAVEFNEDERRLYDQIKDQTIALSHEALETSETPRSVSFVNVIQQINSLRLICNMGLQYHIRHDHDKLQGLGQGLSRWASVAQQAFNFEYESGSVSCHFCSSVFNPGEALLGWTKEQVQPVFSECLRFICSECMESPQRGKRALTCGHNPSHPIATVSTNTMGQVETEDMLPMIEEDSPINDLPSKVLALLRQLKAQRPGTKRQVYFVSCYFD